MNQRRLAQAIIVIIIFNITASLFMSGICSGPIDQIFIGWRDLSACNGYITDCLGHTQRDDTGGAMVLALLLIVFASCIALYRLLAKGISSVMCRFRPRF